MKTSSQYVRLVIVGIGTLLSAIFALTSNIETSYWVIRVLAAGIAIDLTIGMLREIKNRKYGVDILAVIAIVSTLIIGEYWASLVIVIMITGGESLENFASNRAKSELKALLSRVPKITHLVQNDGSIVNIPVADVKPNMILQIRAGEVLPVDGVLIQGSGYLDESSITGESLPVEVNKGDAVMSGAVNGTTVINIKALKTAQESEYSEIVRLVQIASESTSPFVRLADRYAVPFTLVSVLIGILAWIISGDPKRFAEVLVVATPCPLLIAAPVAIISGMSRASKRGIIIKSGAVLEKLSEVKTMIFDKTGTLTENILEIAEIIPSSLSNEKELITIAASLEQGSSHVLARAISIYAKDNSIKLKKVYRLHEEPGNGINGYIDKQFIKIGSQKYLKRQKVNISEIKSQEKTAIYIARDGEYLGVITFKDALRKNSHSTIKKLSKSGISNIAMLTGDNNETAQRIAKLVGITDVVSECLPQDKLNALNKFKNKPIAMIGDGINDAPVLAASDVGIAMGSRGETVASESSDIVIMLDDISKVYDSYSISRKSMRIATQSVLLGIGLSVGLEIFAAFGFIPALFGAGMQEAIDILVISNALRAHSDKPI